MYSASSPLRASSSDFVPQEGNIDRLVDIIMASGAEDASYRDKFLRDEAIKKLCDKLRIQPKRKLILRGNFIAGTGAQAIAELVATQDELTELSLEWNQLGNKGGIYFADALKTNRSLLTLDLKNNSIGSDAAISLAEAIFENPMLKTLDLRWNQIDDRGALAFKSAILDRKPSLRLLINGNPLTETTIATINAWQKKGQEMEDQVEEVEFPKQEEEPRQAQFDFLQKELFILRQQCASMQSLLNDKQRQLDTSAFRVTELEQQLARETFRGNHLNDSLQEAMLRISILNDQLASLTASWDKERTGLVNEYMHQLKLKDKVIRDVSMERDDYKSQRDKLAERVEELTRLWENAQSQLDSERMQNQENMRIAHTKIHEMTLEKTEIKAENNQLKGKAERLEEKVNLLENQIEVDRTEHHRLVKQEHEFYLREVERLKAEHASIMNALLDRNSAQTKKIQNLEEDVITLRGEIVRQTEALRAAYEEAIVDARELERQKQEQVIVELKQRLETFISARQELESRCKQYSREIQDMRVEHETLTSHLRSQLAVIQEEVERLRENSNLLKTKVAGLESDVKTRDVEIYDFRKRLQNAEEQATAWRKELHIVTIEKNNNAMEAEKYKQLTAQLREARIREFAVIRENVLEKVRAEFDSVRIEMKIPNLHDEH